MNVLHPSDYVLIAGVALMALVGFWAYVSLQTIGSIQNRVKFFQRIGVITGLILLLIISVVVKWRQFYQIRLDISASETS